MTKWLTCWTLVMICTSTSLTQAEVFERVRAARLQEELAPQGPANAAPTTEPTTPSPSDSVVVENGDRAGQVAPPADIESLPAWGGYDGVGQKEMYPFVESPNKAGDPCCQGWWDNYCAERHCGPGLFKLRHHGPMWSGKGCDSCVGKPTKGQPVFQKGMLFHHQKGAAVPHQKHLSAPFQKGLGIHHQKGPSPCHSCQPGEFSGHGVGYGHHRPYLGLFDWKLRHAPVFARSDVWGAPVEYPAGGPVHSGYAIDTPARPHAAPQLHFDVPAFEPPSRLDAGLQQVHPENLELEPVRTNLPESSHSA
jgi:hypothetical protein